MALPVQEGALETGIPPHLWRPIASGIGATMTIIASAWALGLQAYLGIGLYPQQFIAMILALALPLAFLTLPLRSGTARTHVPWHDAAAAALALIVSLYIAIRFPEVVNQIFFRPVSAWLPGAVLILLLLEALRRSTGWTLVIIILVFLLYAMFGDLVPGRLAGRPQDWQKLAGYMAYDSNGILGAPLAVAATIVLTFILFGNLLAETGGSKFFTDASLVLMGRYRGGSMKIAVASSALFGAISGSAVANVVAQGVITIPMIKRDGYPPHKAAAIEAVASTGGQLMPPVMGAAAFLMAELLQVPYSDIAIAAIVPSLLFYGALLVQADLEAARLGIARTPPGEIPPAATLWSGMHFCLSFAILICTMFWMNWQPERSGLAACAVIAGMGLIFGYDGVKATPGALWRAIVMTGEMMVELVVISAAAGIVIGVLNITGLSFNLTYALVQIGAGSAIVLLLLSALVSIVLGMGLPTLGVYALLAALVAPALVELGFLPIAAHMFVLFFGMMSMVTPPVALAAFAAASIAKASPMKTGWAAVVFGWPAFIVPFLFIYSPSLILIGDTGEIAHAVLTAMLGVWLISAGLAGYFMTRLSLLMRLLFVLAGLAALLPAGAFPEAIYIEIPGVVLGISLMAIEYLRGRRLVSAEAAAE
jgi:TRAP transporter 4TM/12TM fusion protein